MQTICAIYDKYVAKKRHNHQQMLPNRSIALSPYHPKASSPSQPVSTEYRSQRFRFKNRLLKGRCRCWITDFRSGTIR